MTKKFIDTTDKAKAKDSDEESKDEFPERSIEELVQEIAELENKAAKMELQELHERDSKDRRHERAPEGLKLSDFKKVMGQKLAPKVISKTKREFYPYTALAKATGKYMKRSVLMFYLSKK